MTARDHGELFDVQRSSLAKVRDSFLDGRSLRGGARLGVEGDVAAFFRGRQDSGEIHGRAPMGMPDRIVTVDMGREA
jgi:hypothetical protein